MIFLFLWVLQAKKLVHRRSLLSFMTLYSKISAFIPRTSVTKMDYWVSYVAYFCDIYFRASFDIIEEHDYLNKIIDRIPYSNPDTKQKMENIRTHLAKYIHDAPGVRHNYNSLPSYTL